MSVPGYEQYMASKSFEFQPEERIVNVTYKGHQGYYINQIILETNQGRGM